MGKNLITQLSESHYKINGTDANEIDPKWHKLYLPLSNRQQGRILLSFLILEKEKYSDIKSLKEKLKICPKTSLYEVEINCLGLRDIMPLSLLPVKKPYIIFDVNGINFKNSNKNLVSSIKTDPKETGPNPNINSIIKFDLNLPDNPIFVPQLQCLVNDYMLSGLINPLLGIFLIDLKTIIEFHEKNYLKDLEKLENKIQEINSAEYIAKKLSEEKKEKDREKVQQKGGKFIYIILIF